MKKFASDLYASKTWQSVLTNNLKTLGDKPVDEFLRRPRYELYDVENDPFETVNLANEPDYQEILTGLQAQLKGFQQASKDPWVYKWEYE